MWRSLTRPMGQFTRGSFTTVRYQSSHYTRRFMTQMQKPYTKPVSVAFLGWLFGSIDYDAVRKDIADILEDYDWDDGMCCVCVFTYCTTANLRYYNKVLGGQY